MTQKATNCWRQKSKTKKQQGTSLPPRSWSASKSLPLTLKRLRTWKSWILLPTTILTDPPLRHKVWRTRSSAGLVGLLPQLPASKETTSWLITSSYRWPNRNWWTATVRTMDAMVVYRVTLTIGFIYFSSWLINSGNGLEQEDAYTYTAQDGTCEAVAAKEKVFIDSYDAISTNEDEIAQALMDNGPLAIGGGVVSVYCECILQCCFSILISWFVVLNASWSYFLFPVPCFHRRALVNREEAHDLLCRMAALLNREFLLSYPSSPARRGECTINNYDMGRS